MRRCATLGLLFLAAATSLFLSCARPDSENECVDDLPGPFLLEDYFPVAVGNSWTWRLYLSEEPGDESTVDFTLTIDDVFNSGPYQVWHGILDAPWYLIMGLSWLFGGEDSGYITALNGNLYYCRDGWLADDRIAALPDLEGWKIVPLHTDLTPRYIETVSDGKPLFIQYCGAFPESLIYAVNMAPLPEEFFPVEPAVILHTTENGYNWTHNRMILARGVGILFGRTALGKFYLNSATLNQPEPEPEPEQESPGVTRLAR